MQRKNGKPVVIQDEWDRLQEQIRKSTEGRRVSVEFSQAEGDSRSLYIRTLGSQNNTVLNLQLRLGNRGLGGERTLEVITGEDYHYIFTGQLRANPSQSGGKTDFFYSSPGTVFTKMINRALTVGLERAGLDSGGSATSAFFNLISQGIPELNIAGGIQGYSPSTDNSLTQQWRSNQMRVYIPSYLDIKDKNAIRKQIERNILNAGSGLFGRESNIFKTLAANGVIFGSDESKLPTLTPWGMPDENGNIFQYRANYQKSATLGIYQSRTTANPLIASGLGGVNVMPSDEMNVPLFARKYAGPIVTNTIRENGLLPRNEMAGYMLFGFTVPVPGAGLNWNSAYDPRIAAYGINATKRATVGTNVRNFIEGTERLNLRIGAGGVIPGGKSSGIVGSLALYDKDGNMVVDELGNPISDKITIKSSAGQFNVQRAILNIPRYYNAEGAGVEKSPGAYEVTDADIARLNEQYKGSGLIVRRKSTIDEIQLVYQGQTEVGMKFAGSGTKMGLLNLNGPAPSIPVPGGRITIAASTAEFKSLPFSMLSAFDAMTRDQQVGFLQDFANSGKRKNFIQKGVGQYVNTFLQELVAARQAGVDESNLPVLNLSEMAQTVGVHAGFIAKSLVNWALFGGTDISKLSNRQSAIQAQMRKQQQDPTNLEFNKRNVERYGIGWVGEEWGINAGSTSVLYEVGEYNRQLNRLLRGNTDTGFIDRAKTGARGVKESQSVRAMLQATPVGRFMRVSVPLSGVVLPQPLGNSAEYPGVSEFASPEYMTAINYLYPTTARAMGISTNPADMGKLDQSGRPIYFAENVTPATAAWRTIDATIKTMQGFGTGRGLIPNEKVTVSVSARQAGDILNLLRSTDPSKPSVINSNQMDGRLITTAIDTVLGQGASEKMMYNPESQTVFTSFTSLLAITKSIPGSHLDQTKQWNKITPLFGAWLTAVSGLEDKDSIFAGGLRMNASTAATSAVSGFKEIISSGNISRRILGGSFASPTIRYNLNTMLSASQVALTPELVRLAVQSQFGNSGFTRQQLRSIESRILARTQPIQGVFNRYPEESINQGYWGVQALTPAAQRAIGVVPDTNPASRFFLGVSMTLGENKTLGDFDQDIARITLGVQAWTNKRNPTNVVVKFTKDPRIQWMIDRIEDGQFDEQQLLEMLPSKLAREKFGALTKSVSDIFGFALNSNGRLDYSSITAGIIAKQMAEARGYSLEELTRVGNIVGASKMQMGTTYNMIRMLASSSAALGWSDPDVIQAVTIKAQLYQPFLDKLSGDKWGITSLFQSSFLSYNNVPGAKAGNIPSIEIGFRSPYSAAAGKSGVIVGKLGSNSMIERMMERATEGINVDGKIMHMGFRALATWFAPDAKDIKELASVMSATGSDPRLLAKAVAKFYKEKYPNSDPGITFLKTNIMVQTVGHAIENWRKKNAGEEGIESGDLPPEVNAVLGNETIPGMSSDPKNEFNILFNAATKVASSTAQMKFKGTASNQQLEQLLAAGDNIYTRLAVGYAQFRGLTNAVKIMPTKINSAKLTRLLTQTPMVLRASALKSLSGGDVMYPETAERNRQAVAAGILISGLNEQVGEIDYPALNLLSNMFGKFKDNVAMARGRKMEAKLAEILKTTDTGWESTGSNKEGFRVEEAFYKQGRDVADVVVSHPDFMRITKDDKGLSTLEFMELKTTMKGDNVAAKLDEWQVQAKTVLWIINKQMEQNKGNPAKMKSWLAGIFKSADPQASEAKIAAKVEAAFSAIKAGRVKAFVHVLPVTGAGNEKFQAVKDGDVAKVLSDIEASSTARKSSWTMNQSVITEIGGILEKAVTQIASSLPQTIKSLIDSDINSAVAAAKSVASGKTKVDGTDDEIKDTMKKAENGIALFKRLMDKIWTTGLHHVTVGDLVDANKTATQRKVEKNSVAIVNNTRNVAVLDQVAAQTTKNVVARANVSGGIMPLDKALQYIASARGIKQGSLVTNYLEQYDLLRNEIDRGGGNLTDLIGQANTTQIGRMIALAKQAKKLTGPGNKIQAAVATIDELEGSATMSPELEKYVSGLRQDADTGKLFSVGSRSGQALQEMTGALPILQAIQSGTMEQWKASRFSGVASAWNKINPDLQRQLVESTPGQARVLALNNPEIGRFVATARQGQLTAGDLKTFDQGGAMSEAYKNINAGGAKAKGNVLEAIDRKYDPGYLTNPSTIKNQEDAINGTVKALTHFEKAVMKTADGMNKIYNEKIRPMGGEAGGELEAIVSTGTEKFAGSKAVAPKGTFLGYRKTGGENAILSPAAQQAYEEAQDLQNQGAYQIQQSQRAAGIGGFARRALGGFGLMYLRSMGSMITEGLNSGYAESVAAQSGGSAMAIRMAGGSTTPFLNPENLMSSSKAFAGSPQIGLKTVGAKLAGSSGLNTLGGMLSAGAGAFAAAEWLSSISSASLTGFSAFLGGPAAPVIAAGAALAVGGAQVYGMSQNWQQTGAQVVANRAVGVNGGFAELPMMIAENNNPNARGYVNALQFAYDRMASGSGLRSAAESGAIKGGRTTGEVAQGLYQTLLKDSEGFKALSAEQQASVAGMMYKYNINPITRIRTPQQIPTETQPYDPSIGGISAGPGYVEPPPLYKMLETDTSKLLSSLTGAGLQPGAVVGALTSSFGLSQADAKQFGSSLLSNTNFLKAYDIDTEERYTQFAQMLGQSGGGAAFFEAAKKDMGRYQGPARSGGSYQQFQQQQAANLLKKYAPENMTGPAMSVMSGELQLQALISQRGGAYTLPEVSPNMTSAQANTQLRKLNLEIGAKSFDPTALAKLATTGQLTTAELSRLQMTPEEATLAMGDVRSVNGVRMASGLAKGWSSYQIGGGAASMSEAEYLTSVYGNSWRSDKNILAGVMNTTIGGAGVGGASGVYTQSGRQLFGREATQVAYQRQQFDLQGASIGIAWQQLQATQAFTTGVGIQKYAGTINPQTGQPFNFNTGSFNVNVPGVGSYTSTGGGLWGIEDAQRNLGYMQTEWQFGQQKAQIAMSSRQFYENLSANRFQQLQSREWTKEDWGYQENVRGMQRAWQVQDFGEQERFLTGRERKMAVRQFERGTTMFNLEGEQIDKTKERQKKTWQLEDEAFNRTKKQYEEQKKFQLDAIATMQRFFNAQKKLQEEAILLQRAYWTVQQKLQEQSIGIQAAQLELAKKQYENSLDEKTSVEDTDAIITNLISNSLPTLDATAKTVFSNIKSYIQNVLAALWGANQAGGSGSPVMGAGSASPKLGASGMSYVVPPGYYGDNFPVMAMTGEKVTVEPVNLAQKSLTGFNSDPWKTHFIPNQNQVAGDGKVHLTINIGNEKLGTFIIDRVNQEFTI
jgi:hypothetical protein